VLVYTVEPLLKGTPRKGYCINYLSTKNIPNPPSPRQISFCTRKNTSTTSQYGNEWLDLDWSQTVMEAPVPMSTCCSRWQTEHIYCVPNTMHQIPPPPPSFVDSQHRITGCFNCPHGSIDDGVIATNKMLCVPTLCLQP